MPELEWLTWIIADEMVSAHNDCLAAAFDRLMAEEPEPAPLVSAHAAGA
jgi:hypothetical protein